MPNPLNNLQGQQWADCDRCGFPYPISQLVAQEGQLRCTEKCVDNLDIKQHPIRMAEILGTDTLEGVDRQAIDMAFFRHVTDEEYA
jgi:hypothetical protein